MSETSKTGAGGSPEQRLLQEWLPGRQAEGKGRIAMECILFATRLGGRSLCRTIKGRNEETAGGGWALGLNKAGSFLGCV